jgi:hypothetical protein
MQTSCNKVVVKLIPGCVCTACYQLFQQVVCTKFLWTCCHQLVNNLLCTDNIRLVGTTCCKSALASLIFLQDDNNLFQTCQQLGTTSANEIFTHVDVFMLTWLNLPLSVSFSLTVSLVSSSFYLQYLSISSFVSQLQICHNSMSILNISSMVHTQATAFLLFLLTSLQAISDCHIYNLEYKELYRQLPLNHILHV